MVHIDAVICTGLVPHLDHPDFLIGVNHLREIIVMVEITVNFHQIDITTIVIGSTVLVITVGNITTQMVSPRLGVIVRIATQTNIKTGKFKATTRVVIRGPAQINIIMRVMDGTRGLNVVGKVSTDNNSQIFKTTSPEKVMAVKNWLLMDTTETQAVLTLTLLLPYLMWQAL